MAKRFFTADWHLNSSQILKYEARPFASAVVAGIQLKAIANQVCGLGSLLFHVGDFCLTSADRHGHEDDIPDQISAEAWLQGMAPTVLLIEGNHDQKNDVPCVGKMILLDLPSSIKNVSVCHFPSSHPGYCGPTGGKHVHVNVCGHVHSSWLVHYDAVARVLNINVGVDVWKMMPVSDIQVAEIASFVFGQKLCGRKSFWWKRADYDNAVSAARKAQLAAKAKRKKDKHEAKGLTPEECERRKQAAMAAKAKLKAKHR